MQITALSKILTAKHQGDRSYLVVFAGEAASYELFVPGAGYPGEFTGYMHPSLRDQSTGKSWEVDWAQAELIAAHLETVIGTAGAEETVAREVVAALTTGRRYGHEV
jgi:hypothetical protein